MSKTLDVVLVRHAKCPGGINRFIVGRNDDGPIEKRVQTVLWMQ